MGSGIAMKKFGMRDSREKGAGIRDQDPPPPSRPWLYGHFAYDQLVNLE